MQDPPSHSPAGPDSSRTGVRWGIARDAHVVHALLEASDAFAARRSHAPPWHRDPQSTQALVATGTVHLAEQDGIAVATVTLTPSPYFDPDGTGLPPALHPLYMRRLAVSPTCGDPLLGLQAARYAIGRARATPGCDAVRAEANPDLEAALFVLITAGFRRYGTDLSGAAPRTYLQVTLA
ncbi:hypothetical protein ACGFJT_41940 [Actinomadura geliboluensis]|uniref:hypothetical protein n=1 Tax=Actinomadura geliboluensis TaxID=882440 RepID=UPI003723B1A2